MSALDSSSRRDFLKTLAFLFATGLAGSSIVDCQAAQPNNYKIAPWLGDDFANGHKLRNGDLPTLAKTPEKTVDFVIVGGGMAGLSAAYFLKDHNVLLLEQYGELGGQSRGRSYRGIDFSLGAAYMGSKEGVAGSLFSELGLNPVEIPPTKNSWYWEKKWFPGISGDSQAKLYQQFDRLFSEAKPIWNILPPWQDPVPLESSDLKKLDSTNFASYLQGFDPQFISLMDKFCLSAYCGSVSSVSALAGFYLAHDLVSPSYVFKGGNPAVTKALALALESSGKGRRLTNTFVWNLTAGDKYVDVDYGTSDGTMHRVRCRQAIVTAPPMVAGRIVPDLDDQLKAALLWPKYGSYLVSNFCLRKKTFDGSYDNWAGSPLTFADFTIAETPYQALGQYKPEMGSVLTVYQPYPPSSSGRATLMAGNREELASQLVNQLVCLVPQFQDNLEEVVFSRWGHAIAVPVPTFFAKLSKLKALNNGPIVFAHNSTQGLPSAESAMMAARRAASLVLGINPKQR
jgi:protoporphyrinogen oxidase